MKIYIVDLEEVETRYTKQWKKYLPIQLKRHTNTEIQVISGGATVKSTTPGAFLNFGFTNIYKSRQLEQIGEMFCAGNIKDGDYFLYTDAWNPTVLQVKYMAELLNVKIKIGGMWHAGSYDPQDFLGRLIGDKPWVRLAERSMFESFDHNYFATDFHIDMFLHNLLDLGRLADKETVDHMFHTGKIVRCGWPMEYLDADLTGYKNITKKNIIIFPHRFAPEKQHNIFEDLAKDMPQYEFITCLDKCKTKNDYHNLLAEAKLIFSANLQETLGISWYEGAVLGVIPMIPNRLSYKEMAQDEFKYPSEWTESLEQYRQHKHLLIAKIEDYMTNYMKYAPLVHKQKISLADNFFSGKQLYQRITNGR